MHAIMKSASMRRQDRYVCDVPHPLSLDGKLTCFALMKIKKLRLQNRHPL